MLDPICFLLIVPTPFDALRAIARSPSGVARVFLMNPCSDEVLAV